MDDPNLTLADFVPSKSQLEKLIADVKAIAAHERRIGGPLFNAVVEDIGTMSKPGGPIYECINGAFADACAPGGCFRMAVDDCLETACSPGGAITNAFTEAGRNAAARASKGERGKEKGGRLEKLQTLDMGIPDGFPPTVAALKRLTAAHLVALLTAYQQPTGGSLSELRARFSSFIGVT